MTRRKTPAPAAETPRQKAAKGAAHATIGKLIGDDDAVAQGRAEQRRARADRRDGDA